MFIAYICYVVCNCCSLLWLIISYFSVCSSFVYYIISPYNSHTIMRILSMIHLGLMMGVFSLVGI